MPGILRLILTPILLVSLLCAQERTLGEHKGRLTLGKLWTQRILNRDMGKDQFHYKTKGGLFSASQQAFAVVMEYATPVEDQADFERRMDELVPLGRGKPVVVAKRNGYLRGTRRFDAKVRGINATYRLELVSKGGLSYMFMCWTQKAQKKTLDKAAQEILDGFLFPGPSSAWARDKEPARKKLAVPGHELSFEYRPFVLRPQSLVDEQIIHLSNTFQGSAIYGFTNSGYRSADAMLEAAAEACSEGSKDFAIVTREDFEAGDTKGRHWVAKDSTQTYELVCLPLDGDKFLDVRFAYTGKPKQKRFDRDLFLRSIQLTKAKQVLELPDPISKFEPEPLAPRLQELLKHAEEVTTWGEPSVNKCSQLADGSLVLIGSNQAARLTSKLELEPVMKFESWGINAVIQNGDEWLAANNSDSVMSYRNGATNGAATFTAHACVQIGADILLARARFKPGRHDEGSDLIIRRDAKGNETSIIELPDRFVDSIVPSTDQKHLLLVSSPRPSLKGNSAWDSAETGILDLATGAYRVQQKWSSSVGVGVSSTGWLLTGRPESGATGIHHQPRVGSSRPLLLASDVLGMRLTKDHLLFVTPGHTLQESAQGALYRVTLAALESTGRVQPFNAEHLSSIGRDLINSKTAAPSSTAALDATIAKLQQDAKKLTGMQLPTDPPGVDALIEEVNDRTKTETRIVLSLLLAKCLLNEGFLWVPEQTGKASWLSWCVPQGTARESAFATGSSPASLISSTLDDSEGIWEPASHVLVSRKGRKALLGLSIPRLQSAVDAETPANLNKTLESNQAPSLITLLEESPGNTHLRKAVYQRLRTRAQTKLLEQVSKPFATRNTPDPLDVETWLIARSARVKDAKTAAELAQEVLAAIQISPRSSELLFILGQLYERARPKEPAYARTCYSQVLAIQTWGEPAGKARKALERLQ